MFQYDVTVGITRSEVISIRLNMTTKQTWFTWGHMMFFFFSDWFVLWMFSGQFFWFLKMAAEHLIFGNDLSARGHSAHHFASGLGQAMAIPLSGTSIPTTNTGHFGMVVDHIRNKMIYGWLVNLLKLVDNYDIWWLTLISFDISDINHNYKHFHIL